MTIREVQEKERTSSLHKEEALLNLLIWLKRNDPGTALFLLGDGQIKNSEIPESQNLNGVHLGAIVAAIFWLEFYDNKTDMIQSSKVKILDPLCY